MRAKIIKELGLNDQFTIYFTGTVMEEDCDGLCWQYLLKEEKLKPEFVVITEPTNLNIYRGHRGRMEIRVEVKGRSCHGSAPERGDNAIYKIARIALEIEKLNKRLRNDRFLGKGTVTVTEVRSSSPSLCAVADGAGIHLDRRLTAGETKASALAEVRDAAKRAGYPDAKVFVLNYAEAAYTGKVYPTEKYYPTWVLEEKSPYLKRRGGGLQGSAGQGSAGGQVDLQHERHRHRRHEGHSVPRAWAGQRSLCARPERGLPRRAPQRRCGFLRGPGARRMNGKGMTPFLYQCSTCGKTYQRDEVRYLCPACAKDYRPGIPARRSPAGPV